MALPGCPSLPLLSGAAGRPARVQPWLPIRGPGWGGKGRAAPPWRLLAAKRREVQQHQQQQQQATAAPPLRPLPGLPLPPAVTAPTATARRRGAKAGAEEAGKPGKRAPSAAAAPPAAAATAAAAGSAGRPGLARETVDLPLSSSDDSDGSLDMLLGVGSEPSYLSLDDEEGRARLERFAAAASAILEHPKHVRYLATGDPPKGALR